MDKAAAKKSYQFSASRPVLAILGGSQGSVPFNRHFQNHLEQYTKSNIQILWQCGKSDFSELKELNRQQDVHIIPFIENIHILCKWNNMDIFVPIQFFQLKKIFFSTLP